MAILVGSSGAPTLTRFSSTVARNSGPSDANMQQFLIGNTSDFAATATGTARNLQLYISSWGTQSNIKCNIYDETAGGALVESVIVNSSEGTGLLTIPLAETTTITSGRDYRLGIYTEDADSVTFFSDTGALTLRLDDETGNYTTPNDPVNAGIFDSFNELYWAIDDEAAGATVTITEDNLRYGETGNFVTSGLGALTTATLTDSQSNVINVSFTATTFSIPALADEIDGQLTGTVTLTVGDGTNTAQDTFVLQPPANMTAQPVLAGFTTVPPSVYQDFSGTVQEGEQSLYVTAEWNEFDGLGKGEVPQAGTYTIFHISLDGRVQSYNIIFGEAASSEVVRAIDAVSINSEAIDAIIIDAKTL